MSAAIDLAAKQKCQSKSDYLRQSIIRQPEADGIALPHAAPDVGALYDRLSDGQQRYALRRWNVHFQCSRLPRPRDCRQGRHGRQRCVSPDLLIFWRYSKQSRRHRRRRKLDAYCSSIAFAEQTAGDIQALRICLDTGSARLAAKLQCPLSCRRSKPPPMRLRPWPRS